MDMSTSYGQNINTEFVMMLAWLCRVIVLTKAHRLISNIYVIIFSQLVQLA